MYRPRYTTLLTLLALALVGLLALPLQLQAAGTNIDANASIATGRTKCDHLPPAADGSTDTAASRDPKPCTPTPTKTCSSAGDRREDAKKPKRCTPTPTSTNTPTTTHTPTPEPTATDTPTATATATPTNTPTPEPTATDTRTPTATATNTPMPPTDTPTPVPTDTATPTSTPTATATNTPTPVPPANITVYNTGAFFVQYYVSYNLPGMPLQSLYSGVFNINQGVTLSIPGTATNVGVLVQLYNQWC